MSVTPKKEARLAVRLSQVEKSLIERAAEQLNVNTTDFALTAMLSKADEVLKDQTIFHVSDEHFEWLAEFVNRPWVETKGWRNLMDAKTEFSFDKLNDDH